MKFSHAFVKTLREAPSDAEVKSHQLLVRAGFIRKVAAGIYEYLPFGLKSLRKVESIIRDELNKAGCQEVFLPHLVPAELWQESGRWQKYGPELLRLKDRHQREYCFGPTHEEVICDLVRATLSSYKSLPMHLYQIQTKVRDEIRPRFGLMRGREFLMKDSYSFHANSEDLEREYLRMYQVYLDIFKRCGLDCRAVEADTGAIGGSSSHEFMVLAETGEDLIASCQQCQFAANIEKATYRIRRAASPTKDPQQRIATPGVKFIADVSAFLKIKPSSIIKTLVYRADDLFLIVCLAGDREVSEIKLGHLIDAECIRLAQDVEVDGLTGVPLGYLGPVGLEAIIRKRSPAAQFRIIYDRSILECAEGTTGGNLVDSHLMHVSFERDLGLNDETHPSLCDVSVVKEGDPCPACDSGNLSLIRGIEVGHIFKLGDRYSKPMKVNYLDRDGKDQNTIMGTYGIGVGRTMASSIEQNHDDKGIIWPKAIAPFEVCLLTLDSTDGINALVSQLYSGLQAKGIDVMWDDRDERAGVKFNDADLIGYPLQIVVGKRGFDRNEIEFKVRRTGEKGTFPIEVALQSILGKLAIIN